MTDSIEPPTGANGASGGPGKSPLTNDLHRVRPARFAAAPFGVGEERPALPFVVGVIGAFGGEPAEPRRAIGGRRFVTIDRDNFDSVMSCLRPGVAIEVPNVLGPSTDGPPVRVNLSFACMDDFEPARVAEQIPALGDLLAERRRLGTGELARMAAIDAILSRQLSLVMRHGSFRRLEGSWRGLHFLVVNTETGKDLRVRVMDATRAELADDLVRGGALEDSSLFSQVLQELDTIGGTPFGAMIVDEAFSHGPTDIDLLEALAQVGAAGFCPIIAAAAPSFFGVDSFHELANAGVLDRRLLGPQYARWWALRSSDASRFLVLTLPRSLARIPYGAFSHPVAEFAFEESADEAVDTGGPCWNPDEFCWMSTAYAYGSRLTEAFATRGNFSLTRGVHGGGVVAGLPVSIRRAKRSEADDLIGPTECFISERHEALLSAAGLLPIVALRNTPSAVFFSASTVHKPTCYDDASTTHDAACAARMPFVLIACRVAHHVRWLVRDRRMSLASPQECEAMLTNWICDWVTTDGTHSAGAKLQRPLWEGSIRVEAMPDEPGRWNAVVTIRPRLHFETLVTAVSFVVPLPAPGG